MFSFVTWSWTGWLGSLGSNRVDLSAKKRGAFRVHLTLITRHTGKHQTSTSVLMSLTFLLNKTAIHFGSLCNFNLNFNFMNFFWASAKYKQRFALVRERERESPITHEICFRANKPKFNRALFFKCVLHLTRDNVETSRFSSISVWTMGLFPALNALPARSL